LIKRGRKRKGEKSGVRDVREKMVSRERRSSGVTAAAATAAAAHANPRTLSRGPRRPRDTFSVTSFSVTPFPVMSFLVMPFTVTSFPVTQFPALSLLPSFPRDVIPRGSPCGFLPLRTPLGAPELEPSFTTIIIYYYLIK